MILYPSHLLGLRYRDPTQDIFMSLLHILIPPNVVTVLRIIEI